MRFADKKHEFRRTIEMVCLFMSLGAVFLQIWVLVTAIDAYFKNNFHIIVPLVILSGLSFLICGLSFYLTDVNFLKGITEGRTKTYQKGVELL
jgi:hypothetical protein